MANCLDKEWLWGNHKGEAEESEGESVVSKQQQQKNVIWYLLNFILGLRKGNVSQMIKYA